MTAKKTINEFIFLLSITVLLSSCEGFKILTVYNRTGREFIVQTKPELPRFKHTSLSDATQLLSGIKDYKVPPDSSLTLLARFGALLFNAKIKETDLVIDYLKIITNKDTIIANNRTEIIRLAKSEKTKFRKKSDKNYALDDNKNIEAIVIRE